MSVKTRSPKAATTLSSETADMELEDILAVARRLADTVVREETLSSDAEARWPAQSFAAIQKRGLAGLVVPKEHGGLGQGLTGLIRVCEVFGRESASFAISYGMHCVGSAVIAAKARRGIQTDLLQSIAAGEHITTLALSEPGTGVHFYFPESTLSPVLDGGGGEWRVKGQKSFVTNGGEADSYVVSTMIAPQSGNHVTGGEPGLFSMVLVPSEADGLRWGEPYNGMGMRGNSARSAHLNDVRLADDLVLGEHGDQIWYVFNVVAPFFLAAMAGTYLGIAGRALDEGTQHVQARTYAHNGAGLSDSAVVQHRIGSLWAMVERTRRLVYWAADEGDIGGPDALPGLCSAKAEVGDCAVQVVNEVMTLMGGVAYRDNALLPRLLRDARAVHVMAPTTDLLRTWTGRALLGVPILGE